MIDRLAKLPFDAQPGEKFVYGYNSDILGVVIEKVSGMQPGRVLPTRIFQPLKMVDSSFFLPLDKRERLAAVYSLVDGKLQRAPNPGLGQGDYVDGPRMCYSGGAGVLSTASDYARFLQMLLNGGELDGVRLLEPEDGGADDLEPRRRRSSTRASTGFGLGFEILDNLGKVGRDRISRRLLMGRRISHGLLGRPEGEARGGADDAAAARERQRSESTSSGSWCISLSWPRLSRRRRSQVGGIVGSARVALFKDSSRSPIRGRFPNRPRFATVSPDFTGGFGDGAVKSACLCGAGGCRGLVAGPRTARAQGCVLIRQNGPLLGQGMSPDLAPGQCEFSFSTRNSTADKHYKGDVEQVQRQELGTYVLNKQHAYDFALRYQANHRLGFTSSIPLIDASWALPYPLAPAPGDRVPQRGVGLGDLTVAGRYWLLDPLKHARGNVEVGLGIKMPTGSADDTAFYPTLTGAWSDKAIDQSAQPGDGGVGMLFDAQGYWRFGKSMIYTNGSYLSNPKNTNGTPSILVGLLGPAANTPANANKLVNSVADQYLLRIGGATNIPRHASPLGLARVPRRRAPSRTISSDARTASGVPATSSTSSPACLTPTRDSRSRSTCRSASIAIACRIRTPARKATRRSPTTCSSAATRCASARARAHSRDRSRSPRFRRPRSRTTTSDWAGARRRTYPPSGSLSFVGRSCSWQLLRFLLLARRLRRLLRDGEGPRLLGVAEEPHHVAQRPRDRTRRRSRSGCRGSSARRRRSCAPPSRSSPPAVAAARPAAPPRPQRRRLDARLLRSEPACAAAFSSSVSAGASTTGTFSRAAATL